MNDMSTANRDYASEADERWVKKAALECAEKYAAGADDLDRYETFLLVGLLSRGLLSLLEFESCCCVEYDDVADAASGDGCYHVYVYVHGPEERAELALDITCNLQGVTPVKTDTTIAAANTEFKPVTKEQAVGMPRLLFHKRLRNSDGSALRVRSTGKCQVWKTRPTEFKLPVKYGMYESFYITHANACDWSLEDPTDKP